MSHNKRVELSRRSVIKGGLLERVSQVHLWLVSMEIISITAFFALIYSGSQGAVAKVSANLLLTESLALPFWLLLILAGLVGPLVFYVQQSQRQKKAPLAMKEQNLSENADMPAGVYQGASAKSQNALLLCDGAVMVGGLTLRCLIVFAALLVWTSYSFITLRVNTFGLENLFSRPKV